MLRTCVRQSTLPAPRKSRPLNAAWLMVCRSAAVSATVARTPPVFDAVERQQALQVVLLQRVEHAEEGRARAQQEHRPSPGGRQRRVGRGKEVEGEAQHAVDRHLEHHPRHQRRDVAGGRGVRARQPDVERDDAGLGGEPREGQEEQHRPGGTVEVVRRSAQGLEAEAAGALGERQEGDEEQGGAAVGHHQVEQPGAGVFAIAVVGDDEDVAREGHALPAEQEGQRVAGAADQRHAAQEDVQRQHLRRLPRRPRVGRVLP
jgi:hypothetical protein